MTLADRLVYRSVRLASRLFLGVFGGVRVNGRDNLPSSGRFLICANHSSLLDPPVVSVGCPLPIGFVAKRELFEIPGFGWLIRRLLAVPVDRRRLGKQTVDSLSRLLNQGVPVLVFPEGTRSRTGKFGRGKAGIGLLAHELDVPLIPAYLHGTRYWPRSWSAARRISVTFGVPLSVEWIRDTARQQAGYQMIADHVMQEIQKLRDRSTVLLAERAGREYIEAGFYARTGESR